MKNISKKNKNAAYIIKNKDKLIRNRKRIRTIRKRFFLIVLMVSVLTTLLFKLPYFNISKINVVGNEKVTYENILQMSGIKVGNNIFYMRTSKIKNNILNNPYIAEVKIDRKLPKGINISVKEKVAVFYYKYGDYYAIIDENGYVLEKKESIKTLKLVKLDGINAKNFEVGKLIPIKDSRELKVIKNISELIDINNKNKNNNNITSVDLGNLVDIKIYCQNFYVKIGTSQDLNGKFQKGMNIILQSDFKDKKGYVDVSFKCNPVIYTK